MRSESGTAVSEPEREARAPGGAWVDPRSPTVAESAAAGESHLLVGSSESVGGSGYVGCGCGRAVCVGSLDVGSVRVGELVHLMADLGEARARLEACWWRWPARWRPATAGRPPLG